MKVFTIKSGNRILSHEVARDKDEALNKFRVKTGSKTIKLKAI